MKKPLFLIKLFHYEYWATWVFYLPLLPYYLYRVLLKKSFTFPILANPSMHLGGLLGMSKHGVLQKVHQKHLPKTYFCVPRTTTNDIVAKLSELQISFPVIAKPDVGERGFNVELLQNMEALELYCSKAKEPFLIQEYIDSPIELGIFYSRLPNQKHGVVSSVTKKEFLTIMGDGLSTVVQLLEKNSRARFQLANIKKKHGQSFLLTVLQKNESKVVEPIGNHCRGTKFVDANDLINSRLAEVMDTISSPIEGFYYGRFDIKVDTIDNLYEGKNIKIIEINGINSEPTHIYDPNYRLWQAYKDVIWHWKRIEAIVEQLTKVSNEDIELGVFLKELKVHFRYKNISKI